MRPFILLAALVTAGAALVASATTPQKADLFELKLSNVMARGVGAEPTGYRTEFADDEVNAYLQLRLASRFPAGVADPSVTLGASPPGPSSTWVASARRARAGGSIPRPISGAACRSRLPARSRPPTVAASSNWRAPR
jgi:hypothetical protein